jgi:hypothetical protein
MTGIAAGYLGAVLVDSAALSFEEDRPEPRATTLHVRPTVVVARGHGAVGLAGSF